MKYCKWSLESFAKDPILQVLVSLLVADSSRRNAVQNLIAEFESEDMLCPSMRSSMQPGLVFRNGPAKGDERGC